MRSGAKREPGAKSFDLLWQQINCFITKQAFGRRMLVPLDNVRSDRRVEIVEKAAHLFGTKGYGRTSMRDIAAAVGILPGSMYYHFPSKEALLAAIHEEAVDRSVAAVQAAVARHTDPWDRLEAAAAVHLELLVKGGALAAVVGRGPEDGGQVVPELIRQRHRYEAQFRDLVAAVTLPPGVAPGPFRLALLGALNWALTWYRPDRDPPAVVARGLFAIFRASQSAVSTERQP